jgi:hypothetical protein
MKNNARTRWVAKKLMIKDKINEKIKPLKEIPNAKVNKFDKKWN